MRKTKEESEITRQKLLYAALNVFSTLGYDKTRLEDIAHEAGFTRGAIYHNFGSKVQIFEALIDEFGVRASTIVRNVYSDQLTPCENIRAFIEQSLTYIERNENYRKIQILIMSNNLQFHEELKGICSNISVDIDAFLSYLSNLLVAGIKQQEISENINVQATAISILGLINGVSSLWLINQSLFSTKKYAQDIANCFLKGIKK